MSIKKYGTLDTCAPIHSVEGTEIAPASGAVPLVAPGPPPWPAPRPQPGRSCPLPGMRRSAAPNPPVGQALPRHPALPARVVHIGGAL